jgi:chemotaxis protein MotB
MLAIVFASGCAGQAAEEKKQTSIPTPQQCPKLDVQRMGEISEIDKENQQEINRVNGLEKRIADLQEKLTGALGSQPSQASSVSVASTGNKVRVRMSDELLFPSGSARLSDAGRKALDQVASVLKDGANKRIEIAGHSDSVPMSAKKYEDNWELSMERARRVGSYLISQGVDPKKMMMAGYADTEPVDPADSPDARSKNRRVEIFIEPTSGG